MDNNFLIDRRLLMMKLENDRKFISIMLEKVDCDIDDLNSGILDWVEEE